MRTSESHKAIFSMDPSTLDPSPDDRALVCCLLNMRSYIASFNSMQTLEWLFNSVGIGGSDFPPWELCRWKNRSQAADEYEQPLRDEDYPNIAPNEYLA